MTALDSIGFVRLFKRRRSNRMVRDATKLRDMWPGGPTVHEAYPEVVAADYNDRAAEHPAVWTVEDGAIVGRQDSPGSGWGGYLVSERTFGDFELLLEAKPDWPADTGVMVRSCRTRTTASKCSSTTGSQARSEDSSETASAGSTPSPLRSTPTTTPMDVQSGCVRMIQQPPLNRSIRARDAICYTRSMRRGFPRRLALR